MQKSMKPYLLLAGLILSVFFAFGQDDLIVKNYQCHRNTFFQQISFTESTHTANYDILYHRIKWIIDPAQRYITGEVTSHFKALSDGVSTISFDLDDALKIDSVKYHDSKLSFTHSSNIVAITLTNNLNSAEVDSLTVFYQGVPPSSGFGSFSTSIHSDNNDPILWTLSEPYGAMEWWPCKQSLLDKIDSIDIYVETAPEYKAASNGKLMYEQVNGNKKTTYWKHRHPIATYLVAIAVTNYEAYSHYAKLSTTDSVEILNYVYPEDLTESKPATEYTVGVLETYSKLFIDYPFKDEKYGHAQFGWGGGMEHQTMSFMYNFRQGLIAHELAHQWFGDHVTCASWKDIWVNEGFAVFCEGLIIEALHTETWQEWKASQIGRVLQDGTSGSVYVDDTTSVNRIFNGTLTYTKGGLLLHMLRSQIGDEALFAGINQMLTDTKTSGNFASGNDVKHYLEVAADTTLDWFFDAWYYGEGYPEYTISIKNITNNSISFSVSQTTTHPSVEFFPMHIPIELVGSDQSKIVKVHHTENNQLFNFNTDFRVNNIVFDPNLEVLAPHPANIIDSSIKITSPDNPFEVVPNPITDIIRIHATDPSSVRKTELVDMTGKIVYSKNIDVSIGYIELPVENLITGQYILKIITDFEVFNKTVIKKDK